MKMMGEVMRIIVGPEAMCVERNGVQSETRAIDATHGPQEVRAIARELWETIRPLASWSVWLRHRLKMARQRNAVVLVRDKWPSESYYPGPRPDLISITPWERAKAGEWMSFPHGVVARLLRGEGK